MSETSTENLCQRCGGPAPVIAVMDHEIPMVYCEGCAVLATEEEDNRERERSLAELLRRAGATPRLLEQTLQTHPNLKAREAAERWIDSIRAGTRANLWLTGEVGLGKTGLAWGIVRYLVTDAVIEFWETDEVWRGNEPRLVAALVRWADLLDDLKAAFDADRRALAIGDASDPSALLELAKSVPILALDDLGRERPTPYAVEKLSNLVEERYQRQAPTVVTSNYTEAELAARLGSETEIVNGRRIVSRLYEGSKVIRFSGKTLRNR